MQGWSQDKVKTNESETMVVVCIVGNMAIAVNDAYKDKHKR